jgi:hypothetical protein
VRGVNEPYRMAGISTSGKITTATPLITCPECRGPLRESADGSLICGWRCCPGYGQIVEPDEQETEDRGV